MKSFHREKRQSGRYVTDFYFNGDYHGGMDIFRIHGVIKNYDWGTEDYLSDLLSLSADGRPRAEYWMGTHPSGEAEDDEGEKLSVKAGCSLPFLFKVLSIASPLSLQCHPTRKMAEEGWRRERKAREEGRSVNYTDDNEKAEILSAVTPVTALSGFRDEAEIKDALCSFIPHSYERYLSDFSGIRSLFYGLHACDEGTRREILSELAEHVTGGENISLKPFLTREDIIRETLLKYPMDIGSLFPLLMNVVHLSPFEALYLEPGTLHAYVRGNGIELMSASDNVLRGGLTKKRVDVDELGRIMHFFPSHAGKVQTEEKDGAIYYVTPSESFTLILVRRKACVVLDRASIAFFLSPSSMEREGKTVLAGRGEAYFIPGSGKPVIFNAEGPVFVAAGGKR